MFENCMEMVRNPGLIPKYMYFISWRYFVIQFQAHRKHSVLITNSNAVMLFRKVAAVN
jgi:hypothetical protein